MFNYISVLIIASFAIGAALGLCTPEEMQALSGCVGTFSDEQSSLFQVANSGTITLTQACTQADSLFDKAKKCLAPYQQNCTQTYSSMMDTLNQTYEQVKTQLGCSGYSTTTTTITTTTSWNTLRHRVTTSDLMVCVAKYKHEVTGCYLTFTDEYTSFLNAALNGKTSLTEACLLVDVHYNKVFKQCLESYLKNCSQGRDSFNAQIGAIKEWFGCPGWSDGTCSLVSEANMRDCVNVYWTHFKDLRNVMASGTVTPKTLKKFCVETKSLHDKTITCLETAASGEQNCTTYLKDEKNYMKEAADKNRICTDISSGSSLYSVFYVTFFCLILTGGIW